MTTVLAPCHVTTDPAILDAGTPVVLLSTLNPDGSANLAPISSAFWLDDRCVLGLAGLTPVASDLVGPPRAAQCPLATEVVVTAMTNDPDRPPTVEGCVVRVHTHPRLLVDGRPDRRIDRALVHHAPERRVRCAVRAWWRRPSPATMD